MTDLIELAKQQAAEIACAGHNGWGNTMLELAAALEAAQEALRPLAELDLTPDDFDQRTDSQPIYARNKTAITVGDVCKACAALGDVCDGCKRCAHARN